MDNKQAIEILKIKMEDADDYLKVCGGDDWYVDKAYEGSILALNMAIKAMEKQEKKEPKNFDDFNMECPNCKMLISPSVCSEDNKIIENVEFCYKCGQALRVEVQV